MNRLSHIITLLILLSNHIQAANYTATIQAGELETSIESPSSITELVLTGTIDARDFAFMADSLRQITLLDLSQCSVLAWKSRDKYLGTETQFESDVIPSHAFLGLEGLTTVKLPSNITKIGDGAFAGCAQLSSMEWGEQLQEIGAYSFAGCSLLNTTLPSTLATIGEYAFEKCVAYTSIELEQTQIRTIGNYAFAGCTSATHITLPATLKALGNNAFAGCSALSAINLPASLSQMGNSCFAHCENLASVNMKECTQLSEIAPFTFDHCTKLTSLEAPASINNVGEGAFYYCQSFAICALPSSTRHIGDYAFAKTAITELNFLSEGIEEIGRWPFYGLDYLQTAMLPSTLLFINDHAFDNCTAITSLYCEAATPPTLGENVFQDVPQASCQLFIPEESTNLYKSAEQWNEFLINNSNSKEEITFSESVKAFFIGDILTIKSPVPLHRITLYTTDGRIVYSQQSTTTHETIDTQAYSSNIFILSVQKESGEYEHVKLGRSR